MRTTFSNLSWDLVEEILSRVPTRANIEDLPSIKEIGKILSPIKILEVYQCDGLFLLLCLTKCKSRLVLWNPYLAQTRWIEGKPISDDGESCTYAIGYNNNHNYKLLRILHEFGETTKHELIYNFNTNSWRVLDITNNYCLPTKRESLTGNSYFIVRGRSYECCIICFYFTNERFGPLMHLPFHTDFGIMVPSCVREEQLAVLHQYGNTYEIWITTKIESNAMSWSKLLKVDMEPFTDLRQFNVRSFLIDMKKKVAMVCGRCNNSRSHDFSFVVGEDGYYKKIGSGGDVFSYVPSPVLIQ